MIEVEVQSWWGWRSSVMRAAQCVCVCVYSGGWEGGRSFTLSTNNPPDSPSGFFMFGWYWTGNVFLISQSKQTEQIAFLLISTVCSKITVLMSRPRPLQHYVNMFLFLLRFDKVCVCIKLYIYIGLCVCVAVTHSNLYMDQLTAHVFCVLWIKLQIKSFCCHIVASPQQLPPPYFSGKKK